MESFNAGLDNAYYTVSSAKKVVKQAYEELDGLGKKAKEYMRPKLN